MIFRYKQTESGRHEPIVPVHLKISNVWFSFNAFIDTGADYSVFHAKIAAFLGIKMENGRKMSVMVGDGDHMNI